MIYKEKSNRGKRGSRSSRSEEDKSIMVDEKERRDKEELNEEDAASLFYPAISRT